MFLKNFEVTNLLKFKNNITERNLIYKYTGLIQSNKISAQE